MMDTARSALQGDRFRYSRTATSDSSVRCGVSRRLRSAGRLAAQWCWEKNEYMVRVTLGPRGSAKDPSQ